MNAPRLRTAGARPATASAHVPALDGVRAVAGAGVLAFHGARPWATGGLVGVDAFFVLSGYLITALLLAEWTPRGGWIDLAAFWGRRVRRLLPALLVMVTVVAVAARALLPPEEVRLLRGDGLAALFYVANWRMIERGGDYFAQTAAPSPLEHTWSLGIEEQFYLVWPLVLGAVLYRPRPGRRSLRATASSRPRARLWWLVLVCGVGAAASTAALAATYSADDPGRAYYGTDTRGAAILVGAALAAALALRGEARAPSPGRTTASTAPPPAASRGARAGLAAAAAAAAALVGWAATHLSGTDDELYHGGMAAIALAVAAVIAHVVLVPSGVSARLLSVPPLPALGRISYGVYLWHEPIMLEFSKRALLISPEPGAFWVNAAVLAVITIALASVTYALVERPFDEARGLMTPSGRLRDDYRLERERYEQERDRERGPGD